MRNFKKFGQQILTRFALWPPMRSYGELVLRPVTIAEQAAGIEVAFSDKNNYKK